MPALVSKERGWQGFESRGLDGFNVVPWKTAGARPSIVGLGGEVSCSMQTWPAAARRVLETLAFGHTGAHQRRESVQPPHVCQQNQWMSWLNSGSWSFSARSPNPLSMPRLQETAHDSD